MNAYATHFSYFFTLFQFVSVLLCCPIFLSLFFRYLQLILFFTILLLFCLLTHFLDFLRFV